MARAEKRAGTARATLWLGLLLVSIALFPGTAHASRPLQTGVFDPQTFPLGSPLAFQRLEDNGATYARITVHWATIAPDRRPSSGNPQNPEDSEYGYHWGGVDQQVELAVDHGIVPVLDIVDTPDWASRFADCALHEICAPDANDFGDFAHAAAARYSGRDGEARVRYWQAWNEPNIHQFLMPQFVDGEPASAEIYRDMLNAFATEVKQVNSDNRVVTGGLAPLKRPGSTAPLAFARRLLCMTGRQRPRPACSDTVQFDIWSTHPYTPGSPAHHCPNADDVCIAELPNMGRLLRAADRARQIHAALDPIPFWVTEFSWDSDPPDPGGVPLRRHARWTAEALYRMWHAGVSAVFWFLLRDQPGHGQAPDIFQSGLYLRGPDGLTTDHAKPALRAFRFPFVAFPRGRRFTYVWGRTPTSGAGPVLIQTRHRGGWRPVATLQADRDGIFRHVIKNSGGEARALIEDPYTEEIGTRSLPFAVRDTKDMSLHVFGSTFPTGRLSRAG